MEPILQIENLTHTYSAGTPFQRSAVEGLSLTVGKGEFLGIIGHTGSGKSTLIQHLNGLLQPTSGRILLEGKDIWAEPKKIRDVRFKVGLVFQYPEYQLFEETVYKDIAFGPKNMGLDSGEIDRRVRDSFWAEKKQETFFQISCLVCRCVGGGYLVVKVRGKLTRCVSGKLEVFSSGYISTYNLSIWLNHYFNNMPPKHIIIMIN